MLKKLTQKCFNIALNFNFLFVILEIACFSIKNFI